jgi:GH35 family endo-1,4-beta-xylanase
MKNFSIQVNLDPEAKMLFDEYKKDENIKNSSPAAYKIIVDFLKKRKTAPISTTEPRAEVLPTNQ